MRLLSAALIVLVAGGCGLVLDLDPPEQLADASPRDAGTSLDGAQLLDGARADAGCPDRDLDGFSLCDGDCDDSDATRFPGAPFGCVAGEPLACAPTDEDLAMCAGLFVATYGSDEAAGTPDMPFATLRHALGEAESLGVPVRITMASGDYAEGELSIGADISVYGGYEERTWIRNVGTPDTSLFVSLDPGIRLVASANVSTVLDGLSIVQSATDANAVAVDAGATPVIRGCKIQAGPAGFIGAGLFIEGDPRVVDCDVRLGTSSGPGVFGVVVQSGSPTISNVRVQLNDDATNQVGFRFQDTDAGARLELSRVLPGAGVSFRAVGVQIAEGGATVDASAFDPGACEDQCHGIVLDNISRDVVLTNNRAFGGRPEGVGTGLFILGSLNSSRLDVVNNFFLGGAGPMAPGYGIAVALGGGDTIRAGRFWNNIIRSGPWPGSLPFYEYPGSGAYEPVLFEHNALYAASGGTGLYGDTDSSIYTLNQLHMFMWAERNRADDCGLDPAMGQLDLVAGSICVDTGRAMGSPLTDFYGSPRPNGMGFDVGPHEL